MKGILSVTVVIFDVVVTAALTPNGRTVTLKIRESRSNLPPGKYECGTVYGADQGLEYGGGGTPTNVSGCGPNGYCTNEGSKIPNYLSGRPSSGSRY